MQSQLRRVLCEVLISPGFAFLAACLALPIILEPILPLGQPLGTAYILAWPVLLWTSLAFAVITVTFCDERKLKKLSTRESYIASWYLVNGFFFNSMMDVFAGQFQTWTTMSARYLELEPRYAMRGYVGVVVLLTSLQELLVQTPCGLLLFFAYWRGASWRLGVEVVFNVCSVGGVWYFYVSEAMLGFPYVHAPFRDGRMDLSTAFTFEMLYKFWLGFVIFPGLWAMMGLLLGLRACWQISECCSNADVKKLRSD